jgi:SAM-dependent methyltransferase
MSDRDTALQGSREYWNSRVIQFGHTGWSNAALYAYDQRARIARILELLDMGREAAVLDFGCGTAELAVALAVKNPQARITGIDLSDRVIAVAQDRLRGFPNIRLMVGEIDTAPIEPGTFDMILCVTVLQHIDPALLPAVLGRMSALLRPSGRLILFENVYRSWQSSGYINTGFDEADWREVAAAAGFETTCTTSYPHWGATVVETVLPALSRLRGKPQAAGVGPADGESDSASASARPSRVAALLIRSLLAATWVFDHVFRLPLPRRWRHYAIFAMTKKA